MRRWSWERVGVPRAASADQIAWVWLALRSVGDASVGASVGGGGASVGGGGVGVGPHATSGIKHQSQNCEDRKPFHSPPSDCESGDQVKTLALVNDGDKNTCTATVVSV